MRRRLLKSMRTPREQGRMRQLATAARASRGRARRAATFLRVLATLDTRPRATTGRRAASDLGARRFRSRATRTLRRGRGRAARGPCRPRSARRRRLRACSRRRSWRPGRQLSVVIYLPIVIQGARICCSSRRVLRTRARLRLVVLQLRYTTSSARPAAAAHSARMLPKYTSD